ncbi:MAG: hypothetical protein HY075_00315 [Deltaproteobacteria bacterium]|nr:hypothetical protein [Deltaproteobacteria bacterium]
MRRSFYSILSISLVMAFGTSAFAKKLVPVDSDPSPARGLVVTVRNERAALPKAHVWIETAEGKLLTEGTTGDNGRFIGEISDAMLSAGVSVTAYVEGHAAVSFVANVAHNVSLELPINPPDQFSVMSGKLTGFKDSDDESKAQLGLVAKALEMTDLVDLDTSSFISPMKDSIDVLGKRDIPSNIVLPDQTFPVYFIPIHVDKPVYRLPVLSGSSSRYFGVSGLVNVQDAINAIRQGTAWDIINLLEINKVGVTKPVPVSSPPRDISLNVAQDTAISQKLTLHPGRNTTGGDTRRLAVAAWEPIAGTFVPTDVKLVQSDDVQLTTVENRTAKVLDILVSEKGDHYRGAWLAGAPSSMPDAGLVADVQFNSIDGNWVIRGGETAQLLMAHVEEYRQNSLGSHRYEDRWVLVSPRRGQLRLPSAAYKALQGSLGKISHVSVDLLQMGQTSYPFVSGDLATGDLSVLEKVRKTVQ